MVNIISWIAAITALSITYLLLGGFWIAFTKIYWDVAKTAENALQCVFLACVELASTAILLIIGLGITHWVASAMRW